jgi:hypothetical protein
VKSEEFIVCKIVHVHMYYDFPICHMLHLKLYWPCIPNILWNYFKCNKNFNGSNGDIILWLTNKYINAIGITLKDFTKARNKTC